MRRSLIIAAIVITCGVPALARKKAVPPIPQLFEIGRLTFFDFGPPFDYYDIFIVRPSENGSTVERIALTPPGQKCVQPAKVELARAELSQSVAELLGGVNPCAIPEEELRRERKRCKKCLVFSGADLSMRVQCGAATRIIQANVLEIDWFDNAPSTPQHTSWAMRLLGQLEHATGPGPMNKPFFTVDDSSATKPVPAAADSPAIRALAAGDLDDLFQGSKDKPSELYREAQAQPEKPTVRLVSSSPFWPESFTLPIYPPLARLAGV